jgi:hypothetical protein
MHVLLFERMQFVPERERARDNQSDKNADQKEPAISRQRDQQNGHYSDGDDEARRSLQSESKPAARFRLHEPILARLPARVAMRQKSRHEKKQAWRGS